MSSDTKSIHEFDFKLICEYFSGLQRQGPGSPEATIKALSFIPEMTKDSRIADIGCGTGGQTMVLAKHTKGSITGIDLFEDFITIFNNNMHKINLQHRVKGIVGSMDNLQFQEQELDLIWSEGAIYNIGFEKGINQWRRFLKTGGYLAVTEASWFTEDRPDEINQFWLDAYPQIDTISNKVKQIQRAGYILMAAFILPENCWIEHFYEPQVLAQANFLKKYAGNKTAEDLIANQRHEAKIYSKYKDFYGYVFFIARKY